MYCMMCTSVKTENIICLIKALRQWMKALLQREKISINKFTYSYKPFFAI